MVTMEVLSNVTVPCEGVRFTGVNVEADLHGHGTLGNGSLYIAESQVTWVSADGRGFCMDYPSISLHAVSRDLNAFPNECLYLMVENLIGASPGSDNSDNEENNESGKVSEVRFIPSDTALLDEMFQVMSDCQTLHPDPEDSFSEEEGDDEEEEGAGDANYTGQTGPQILTEQGQRTLQHLEEIFDEGDPTVPQVGHVNGDAAMETTNPANPGQFDDADMQS
eukprot:GHVU01063810.1.p1 GENE.GHVU01063810.1~~GHVU01063810.1.p1  ORF type:complete len:222 (+),score=31.25 GHVU01063810.1:18-683(+)